MLLIFTLLAGTVETIAGQDWPALKYAGAGAAVGGLSLLIWAATFLLLENRNVIDVLHSEVKDVPEVARTAGVTGDARSDGP